VSNRNADASDSGSDPVESLLYSAFVASSERLALADLAGILNVPVEELQVGGFLQGVCGLRGGLG
jgi:hypothetical protein